MNDSILRSIAKMIGIEPGIDGFDLDLIACINTAISTLRIVGIGADDGFVLVNEDQSWSSYLTDPKLLPMAKMYIFLKTKLLFDPPASATVQKAYEENLQELRWTLRHLGEHGD